MGAAASMAGGDGEVSMQQRVSRACCMPSLDPPKRDDEHQDLPCQDPPPISVP